MINRKTTLIAALSSTLACAAPAQAKVFLYTLTGVASGVLGPTEFTNAAVELDGIADYQPPDIPPITEEVPTVTSIRISSKDGGSLTAHLTGAEVMLLHQFANENTPNVVETGILVGFFETGIGGGNVVAANFTPDFGRDFTLGSPFSLANALAAGGPEGTFFNTDQGKLIFTGGDTVSFSVTAASPAPEPSSWVLMLLGLSGVAALRYRRKEPAQRALA